MFFNHETLQYFRGIDERSGPFHHIFGGTAADFGYRFINLEHPFHLIYRLDLSDPAIGVKLPGIDYLPLVYGFHYAEYGGEFTYRVSTNGEIAILKSTGGLSWNPNFPYGGHPRSFPRRKLSLRQQAYDASVAAEFNSFRGTSHANRGK